MDVCIWVFGVRVGTGVVAVSLWPSLRSVRVRKVCMSFGLRPGGKDALSKDFTKELVEQYPDSFEEIDANSPDALVDEMEITVFVDSEHAHDKVPR